MTQFARAWTWTAILVALVALVAIGPGHVPMLTFLVAVLLFSTVTPRVVEGVRGGVTRAREEANSN